MIWAFVAGAVVGAIIGVGALAALQAASNNDDCRKIEIYEQALREIASNERERWAFLVAEDVLAKAGAEGCE